jgi:hypothetical protein
MHQAEKIEFWIVREGEDPYKVAPEVAGAIADELLQPLGNTTCAFCSNKPQLIGAVIAHYLHKPGTDIRNADIYTTRICVDCARMSDEQLAEKTRQQVKAAEKRRKEIRTAWQDMIDSGELVPTGEMRRNPTTGEMRPVYTLKEFTDKKH